MPAMPSELDRPRKRQLMKDWLTHLLNEGRFRDMLAWVDKSRGRFSIRWLHASTETYSSEYSNLFKEWCQHTGKLCPGDTPKRWKANFRCALNSLADIVPVKTMNVTKGKTARRVFEILPEKLPEKVLKKKESNAKFLSKKSKKRRVWPLREGKCNIEAVPSVKHSSSKMGKSGCKSVKEELPDEEVHKSVSLCRTAQVEMSQPVHTVLLPETFLSETLLPESFLPVTVQDMCDDSSWPSSEDFADCDETRVGGGGDDTCETATDSDYGTCNDMSSPQSRSSSSTLDDNYPDDELNDVFEVLKKDMSADTSLTTANTPQWKFSAFNQNFTEIELTSTSRVIVQPNRAQFYVRGLLSCQTDVSVSF